MSAISPEKRVLICSINDKMGGAEQFLRMTALYYARKGYAVDVLFLTAQTGDLWQDIDPNIDLFYTTAHSERKGLLELYRNIRRRKVRYELSFTSHIYMNSLIGLLRNLKLIRVEHAVGRDSHSYFKADRGAKLLRYRLLINIGYSFLDLLVCQTEQMKIQFTAHNKRLGTKIKIEVIPNPVDLGNIETSARIEPTVKYPTPCIVSAGRLITEKGFDILIKAFGRLLHDYPGTKLVIFGEGTERDKLTGIIEEHGLQETVFLPGFEKNIYPYLKAAELCVVSSRIEGFPNILLQMMSQNTKVVSTRCAGGIENLKGVFVCETNSIDSLHDAMKSCLQTNTETNRELFDAELKSRSVEAFIHTIEKYIRN